MASQHLNVLSLPDEGSLTSQEREFVSETAASMAKFAGHDVGALSSQIRGLLCEARGTVGDKEESGHLESLSPEELQKFVYGENVKPLFTIAKSNRSINFGSFGCAPTYVMAMKTLMTMQQEGDSDAWVRVKGPAEHLKVRTAVVKYLSAPVIGDSFRKESQSAEALIHPDEVFLVDNLADATNVIMKSYLANWAFPLGGCGESKRERIIMYFSNQYPMVKAAACYYAELATVAASCAGVGRVCIGPTETASAEGSNIEENACTYPTIRFIEIHMTHEMVRSKELFVETVAKAVVAHNADALFIDHYCWAPTFVVPVVETCRAVKAQKPSCFIVVDGAHSIGQMSLSHLFAPRFPSETHGNEEAEETEYAFDAFMTNCHKWLMAPRSVAVLWVPRRHQRFLHPSVISNPYRGFVTKTLTESLAPSRDHPLDSAHSTCVQAEFFWCGTRDFSNWRIIPCLLSYRSRCLGGDANIMRHNRWLAREGAKAIANIWGTELLLSSTSSTDEGCLVCVGVPSTVDEAATNASICRRVLDDFDSFAAPVSFDSKLYVRVSAQIYNSVADYAHFAKAYLACL